MIDAMVREIGLRRDYLTHPVVETIYFGGGTPSLLSERELAILLDALHRHFRIASDAEVTLEANPDDLTAGQPIWLRRLGINRLSIGIQSFQDDILRFLNRAHDAGQARRSLRCVLDAGFENISTDFIFAIPGRTTAAMIGDLQEVMHWHPAHVSVYGLTIEEKTVFGRQQARGKFSALGEDDQASEFEAVMETLEAGGYQQYEVSNFCRPGFRSKHNSRYWSGHAYLGIGPGAHSFDGGFSRQANISSNPLYLSALRENRIPAKAEQLTLRDRANEILMTTLRTAEGCDIDGLQRLSGYDLAARNREYLHQLTDLGYARMDGSRLVLTRRGRMIADRIAGDLFMAEEGSEPEEADGC